MNHHLLSLTSLAVVSLVTAAVPGPSIFLVMRLAMRRGRGAAMMAALRATAGAKPRGPPRPRGFSLREMGAG